VKIKNGNRVPYHTHTGRYSGLYDPKARHVE